MLKKVKKIAKNLLAIPRVRAVYNRGTYVVLAIFASNRILATLYAIPGFLTFNREQYAVLRGRRDYYRNLSRDRRTSIELRRNIHRLEKGIIMQPRRDIFAKDYIGETIEFYERAIAQYREDKKSCDTAELEWASSVLSRYFELSATGDERVDEIRDRFTKIKDAYKSSGKSVPYKAGDREPHGVKFETMRALAKHRRSVRWFTDRKVSRSDIDKALEVAAQSPTACNRMPYEYRIFDDPKLVKEVADIPFGAGGYSHQIPTIAVVIGKLDSYFSPRDRHAIYVDGSLSAMSFMYALDTLDISSCVINWPDFEPLELKMQKKLGLAPDERVIMLIAIGYADPDGEIPYSMKKDVATFASYNKVA